MAAPTVAMALGYLQRVNLVRELTQRQWHRLCVYKQYLTLLHQETEPLNMP
jgi:hypothetical protein